MPPKRAPKSRQKTIEVESTEPLRRSKRLKIKNEKQSEDLNKVENVVKQKTAMKGSKRKVKEDSPQEPEPSLRASKRKTKIEKEVEDQTSEALDLSKGSQLKSKSEVVVEKAVKVVIDIPVEAVVEELVKQIESTEEKDTQSVSGDVYSMGNEIAGEMGPRMSSKNNKKIKKNEPLIVSHIVDKVSQVVCGAMHTMCLTINGVVLTFGCNDDLALGRQTSNLDESNDSMGEEKAQKEPKPVSGLPKIVKLSAGDMHSAALSDDGSVYIWGNFKDDSNKLGLFHDSIKTVNSDDIQTNDYKETHSPKLVEGLESYKIVDIASGCHHILLLTENGDVLSFGEGSKGQLGRIPSERLQSVSSDRNLLLNPQKVQFDGSVIIKKIWSAHWSSFAQSDTGDIYVWGLNNYHQLGLKTENAVLISGFNIIAEFKPIKSTKMPPNVQMIANGQHHSLILDTSGQVYGCGDGKYGKLGLGESITSADQTVDSPRPISKDAFNSESVSHIACGDFCSFAITESGRLYSWGQGSEQIGTKDSEDRTSPAVVNGVMTDRSTFISVSAGSSHTILIGNSQASSDLNIA